MYVLFTFFLILEQCISVRMRNPLQQLCIQLCARFLYICYISFVTEMCDIYMFIYIIIITYLSSVLRVSVPCWFMFDPLRSP